MFLTYATAIVIAFAVSAVGSKIVMILSRRTAFVDRPGLEPHKQHARAVPYGGGVAMFAAMAIATLSCEWLLGRSGGIFEHRVLGVMGCGAAAMFLLGLRDDLRPMRASVKLLLQALICAIVVHQADLGIDSLKQWPWLANVVAFLWLILVSNAFNLLDHADGLSGSVAAISAVALLSGSALSDQVEFSLLWLSLIASLGGFLIWNFPPAAIYMGDAGSLPLGFLIGAGTLSVTFWPSSESGSQLAVLAPLLITAIPIFDTAVVVIKRIRRRVPIMRGDRQHISHRLTRLGMGPRASLGTVVALQIALAAGALQLRGQDMISAIVVLAQSAGILLAVVLMETNRDHHDP